MHERETKVLALYCYEVGFVSISELPLLMNLSVFLKECILGKWQNCIFKCATHEFTVQKIVSHNMRYHIVSASIIQKMVWHWENLKKGAFQYCIP